MNGHTAAGIADPLLSGTQVWVMFLGAMAVWAVVCLKTIFDAALGAWTARRRHLEPARSRAEQLADQAAVHTEQMTGRPVTARERALLVAFYTPAPEPPRRDSFYDQETDR